MASVQIRLNHKDQERQDQEASIDIPLANANDQEQASGSDCNNNNQYNNHNINNRIENDKNHHLDKRGPPEMPLKRLKKMGWYWGSISPDFASRLLKDEQEGSFLVRDSSSECYIFSITYKLAGQVHHTRIEHSKGQFSFGRNKKFLCATIVDFIEQAIEFSHNGNMLFFLHRDPNTEGPVEFRMIPLSRLRGKSSLKHMCRSAILPYIIRDKISELPIPECLREYLNEPFQHQT